MFYNSQFELQVRPNGRGAADEYFHNGNWFIEGREGSRYTLYFKNNLPTRVMVILSVDGLDVCKGQPAGPDSDGYLVDAFGSIEIPGWKLNGNTAAEFYFAKIGKSYSSESGASTNNVGVIGAMVFREKDLQAYGYPAFPGFYAGYPNGLYTSGGIASASSTQLTRGTQLSGSGWDGTIACASNSVGSLNNSVIGMNSIQPISQSVGTGFGDATAFNTSTVNFERASLTVPDALMVLYYNSAKNLQKMGIQLRTRGNRYDTSTVAKAFPSYNNGCTPPPGWSR